MLYLRISEVLHQGEVPSETTLCSQEHQLNATPTRKCVQGHIKHKIRPMGLHVYAHLGHASAQQAQSITFVLCHATRSAPLSHQGDMQHRHIVYNMHHHSFGISLTKVHAQHWSVIHIKCACLRITQPTIMSITHQVYMQYSRLCQLHTVLVYCTNQQGYTMEHELLLYSQFTACALLLIRDTTYVHMGHALY